MGSPSIHCGGLHVAASALALPEEHRHAGQYLDLKPTIVVIFCAVLACNTRQGDEDPPVVTPGGEAGEAPSLDLQVAPPWSVAHQTDQALVLRLAEGSEGVRVQLATDPQGRLPGLSPILSGRTLEVEDQTGRWPMLAPSFSPVQRVEVLSQGQDLVVRLFGDPLERLLTHPKAPSDPALAWLRVRPRGQTWRLASQGLVILSLPAPGLQEGVAEGSTLLRGSWGQLELESSHPLRTGQGDQRWWVDTLVSPDTTQPYPELGITWTPGPDLSP